MWYVSDTQVLTITVYIQPGAKLTTIAGLHDGLLKIRLNAPAIEGRANEALRKYLAQLFQVSLANVKLLRGEKSRRKTLEIRNSVVKPEQLIKMSAE